jgi:PhnB protein
MPTRLNPYLGFRDNARQAMEFYQSVFGGELTLSTFGEMNASEDPTEQDKIMHGQLETAKGYTLMGADTPNSMDYTPGGSITISLSGEDEEELRGYWDGLAQGGSVTMPLEQAPWGDSFGMLVDPFGVSWMVNISGSGAASSGGGGTASSEEVNEARSSGTDEVSQRASSGDGAGASTPAAGGATEARSSGTDEVAQRAGS